ncbi:MAG: haloalkane dehalogenase [Gammaproteobacteria bacterium]
MIVASTLPVLAHKNAPPPKPTGPAISAKFPYQYKFIEVLGSKMAYVDEGKGDPILFIHGNPTSSYLWRNIMPYAKPYGRIISIDLIGMGKSDKPNIAYTFRDHAKYLGGFIEALGLMNITFVIHDWGSALGMDYARRNESNVKGLVFMEAIVPPSLPAASYEATGPLGDFFRMLRTPGVGEKMVLQNNYFVEGVLPKMGIVRKLTKAEMDVYRAPYPTPKSRKPTLVWPREIPIGGKPVHTTNIVLLNGAWLEKTDLPKLFFYAEPGILNPSSVVKYFQNNLKNIETRYVGVGNHFIQEDHPHAIGRGIAEWLRRLGVKRLGG